MKAPTQILPPTNWQDFEELCKRIWENKWGYPDDIKRNGRAGQSQNGVDIYAYVESKKGYCGIQCKGKDNFTNKQMTTAEIDKEINNAKNFTPALKSLTFATTAPKDAKIEEHVRIRNIENIEKGLFSISVFSWEDIVSLIEQYKSVKEWYVYEKLQTSKPNIKILLNDQEATKEAPVILTPEYTRQAIFFEYDSFAMYTTAVDIINSRTDTKKGNIVKLSFDITNNGDFLENCVFSVELKKSSRHKFRSENLLEKMNSPYIIKDYYMQTAKEFTLHGGLTKTIEFDMEFSEMPNEEEILLECCFTSKQNEKPYCTNLFIKSMPIITELPQRTIKTNEPNKNDYRIEIKPKNL